MSRALSRHKADTVSKYQKQQHKKWIKELGYGKLVPKLNKLPAFWFYMSLPYAVYHFYPEDLNIPPHSVEEVERQFYEVIKGYTYPLHGTDNTLTVEEGFGKYHSLKRTIETVLSKGSDLYRQFAPFLFEHNDPKNSEELCNALSYAVAFTGVKCSSMDGYIYGLKADPESIKDDLGRSVLKQQLGVIRQKANKKHIIVKGKSRLCYELLINEALTTYSIEKITWNEREYTIYVQGHALKRTVERLCMKRDSDSYTILRLHAMYDQPLLYKNQVLIPVAYNVDVGDKVGYYICSFTETECVLMTFLFITQVGTPEGDKLTELLSVDKVELNYLGVVTYDQIVKSDIRNDEYLSNVFRQCKLDHLFEIEENQMSDLDGSASFIKKTLMLSEKGS